MKAINRRNGEIDYSYIKQYDSLMDYDYKSSRNEAVNIYGYIYYFRKDDRKNFYRFSAETHEIKQIPFESINKVILNSSSGIIPSKYDSGNVEKLGYFDYYQDLSDVMMTHIKKDDYYSFLSSVTEVNGRVFFNTSRTKLFEYYPDTKTAKFITSLSFIEPHKSFNIIGTIGDEHTIMLEPDGTM